VNSRVAALLASVKLPSNQQAFGYTQSDMPLPGIKAAQICSGQQAG